jgi:branched-chain amino acid transport system substrate-binding protein
MRKISLARLFMAALLAAVVVLAGCGKSGDTAASNNAIPGKEPYKIGCLTSLTGSVAFLGEDIRDTALLEVEKINAAGGIDGIRGLLSRTTVLIQPCP